MIIPVSVLRGPLSRKVLCTVAPKGALYTHVAGVWKKFLSCRGAVRIARRFQGEMVQQMYVTEYKVNAYWKPTSRVASSSLNAVNEKPLGRKNLHSMPVRLGRILARRLWASLASELVRMIPTSLPLAFGAPRARPRRAPPWHRRLGWRRVPAPHVRRVRGVMRQGSSSSTAKGN